MPKPIFISFANQPQLAENLAENFLALVQEKLQKQESIHISLTGGTMGSAILEYAKRRPEISSVDWPRVHFWWSDERFVPSGDADRNEQQAKDALLASLDIPAKNLHVMGSSDKFENAEDAAADYLEELRKFAAPEADYPLFDLSLLGMGPDGHIASLFPHRNEILNQSDVTLAIHNSPKPPPHRITLTRPVLCGSQQIWFMVSGEDKHEALSRALSAANLEDEELNERILSETPAAGAHGTVTTKFFTDDAARGDLSF